MAEKKAPPKMQPVQPKRVPMIPTPPPVAKKAEQVGKDEAGGREPLHEESKPLPQRVVAPMEEPKPAPTHVEPSADLHPESRGTETPPPPPSVSPSAVQSALDVLRDTLVQSKLAALVHRIQNDHVYTHNLMVRLAVMEYGDGGPLGQLVDTIAKQGKQE